MLVQSQEEKLKVAHICHKTCAESCFKWQDECYTICMSLVTQLSKELLEEKIQNNKMMEKFEEELLDLKDKVCTHNLLYLHRLMCIVA